MKNFSLYLGTIAAFILPFFNIPLILTIRRNKSSSNISLIWTFGVWICSFLMLPQIFVTEDMTFKIFGLVNFVLFSGVVFYVCRHR